MPLSSQVATQISWSPLSRAPQPPTPGGGEGEPTGADEGQLLGAGAPETGRLRQAETLVLEASGASGGPQGGPARHPGRGI